MITFDRTERKVGEACDGFTIYDAAWCECKELQLSDRYGWVAHTMRCISQADRVEVGARLDGVLVGGVILYKDYDPHVGDCMYVVFQYVMPEYRNRGIALKLFKMALEETRRQGLPVLAYTHRLRDWEYKTTYRKL